jgi:hypothetical protein
LVLLAKSIAHWNVVSYKGSEFYEIEGLGKPLDCKGKQRFGLSLSENEVEETVEEGI